MSNESENRIDLTQFEGRTEGSWLERTGGNMARWIVRGQFLENDANEALICAAPDLLAELKRCYEEIDARRSITQDWVKIETFTDDGKDLSVDMEDSDGNCFSGYINRASE